MNIPETVKIEIGRILKSEGGYVNHPADRGGPTNYGITLVTARAFGYMGDMRNLTREMAFTIYYRRFYIAPRINEIYDINPQLGYACFCWGVNSGPSRPIMALQRVLNVCNRQQADWSDISADGGFGPITKYALHEYMRRRSPVILYRAVRALQGAFYIGLAENKESQEAFVNGWLTRALEDI